MKKSLLLTLSLCIFIAANAQEIPYQKYLSFDKKDFRENNFKYDDKTNSWSISKYNGWNTTFNILAIVADAMEDIRPARNDYAIVVQFGKEDIASYVKVVCYNDETYHTLLKFIKEHGENIIETSTGKVLRHQASYNGYGLELNMEQHIISRTSARTADRKTVKNVDESYNEYEFIIRTDVEPWSQYLEKKAAKMAKRDAKGKKKKSVNDLM